MAPIPSQGADAPLAGTPFYLQTSGAATGLGIGDWYTDAAGGNGYHYYTVNIPCPGPTTLPIHMDLFSPELHGAPGTSIDEIRDAADAATTNAAFASNTRFEVYAAGTAIAPYTTPAPGAGSSLLQTTYTPVTTNDAWVRFYTLPTGSACGAYVLRAETVGATANDDNSWRLRVSGDDDANPTTTPPTSLDPGITIGQVYGSMQHDGAGVQCISTYELLGAGAATFNNFDMDGNSSVTYNPPRNGSPSAGTLSGNAVWNVGTGSDPAPRDGDLVNVAANQTGYWRIDTCLTANNQFIQEGGTPYPGLFSLPLSMSLTKTDGVTTAQLGGYLQYTLTFTNTSVPTSGVAQGVTIVDTIPTNTTFDSASVSAPYTGTCTFGSGAVACTINENVAAGASGSVLVNVLVDNPAAGTTVVNNATLDFQDLFSAQFPQQSASDTDQLPSLTLVKASSNPGDTGDGPQVGDVITYTLTVTNTSPVTQTSVVVSDALPAGTSYVAQSTSATGFAAAFSTKTMLDNFSSSSYARQDGPDNWTGNWIEINEADGAGAGSESVTGGQLRVGDNDAGGGEGVYREANLAIAGGLSCVATLSFDVRQNGLDNAFENVTVAISGDGGGSFTTLETFDDTAPGAATPRTYDISAFIAANTRVRFLSSGGLEGGEYVAFDDVQVQNTCYPAGSPTKDVADLFNTNGSYAGSDGTDPWAANWTEINEADGAGAGSERVIGNALRVGDNDAFGGEGVYREADLAIAGGSSCLATLSFDFRQNGLDAGESVAVAISGDGGGSFTTLETFNNGSPGAFTARSYDISGFIAANTRVRFLSNGALEGGEYLEVDNLHLRSLCLASGGLRDNIPGGANGDLTSGVPSTLVQAGDGLTLAPSASSTVTFQVTVTAAGPIENIATALSAEDPDPAEGRVRDVAITRATLAGVRVSAGVVEFATSTQRGTRGFNLYSAPTAARRAAKARINEELIPSPRPDSNSPILYRAEAQVEGPYLWIEEVEIGADGGRMMGPFSVDDEALSRRFERIEMKLAAQPHEDRRGARSLRAPKKVRDLGRILRRWGQRRPGGAGVKIEIGEPGTVYLSWADLVTEGLPQGFARDSRRLRLSSQGTPVAFTATPGGLSFVAKGLSADHAAHNVYVLTWNGVPTMKTALSQSEPPVAPGRTRIQKNWIYYQAAPRGSDPWLWDLLFSGDPWPASWDPTQGDFDLPGYAPSGGSVPVSITLVGRSEGEHHVTATLNGAFVGEATFTGLVTATLEGSVSATSLREAGNQLALTYDSSDSPGQGYAYLNFMDLGLTLPPQPGAVARVSSYDPSLPRLNRADYLIVTHGDFEAQANAIAELKDGRGRSAVVVDVERAYDRFTGGIPDASAVKALIREAGRAKTVLLIGDDTLDPADNYELGEKVFVPSALGWDGFSGRVISENLYADRDDDGAPDLTIGRLSIRTAAEADAMVEKIRNQQSLLAQNLGRHVIAVDNQGLNDMAFRGEGRRIEGMLDEPTTFADVSYGAAAARSSLLAGLHAGALTTTWVGHGAPDHWADEWIFGSDDAPNFANTNQATLLLTWACLSSDYRYFWGPSVSEAMVLAPMGGAAASFGPTGLSLPTLQKELYVRLYPKLMAGMSVGEAVKEAKTEFLAAFPTEREFLNGWVLLGDPDVYLPR